MGSVHSTSIKKTSIRMDAIKKKMEKLANETNDAEERIAHFEQVKAANELEADKFEEQLRVIQKKIQNMESSYDVCIEDLFNQTVKLEGMEKKAGNAEQEVFSPERKTYPSSGKQ